MKPASWTICHGDLELLEACPAASAFDADEDLPTMPWHWWGIFIHRFLEHCKTRGRDEALAYLGRKYPRALRCCSAIDAANLPPGEPEVALALDPARHAARRVRRAGELDRALEAYGKADVLDLSGELPRVSDYKSGANPPDPEGDSQLMGLASAARALAGRPRGPAVGVMVGVRSDGVLTPRGTIYSGGQLDDYDERLSRALSVAVERRVAALGGEALEFRPGEHCEWCHLRMECPSSAHREV